MNRTQPDKPRCLASLCIGSFLAALCLAGCSEPARPAATKTTKTDWTTTSTDRQFEAEADRPPTTKTLWAMAHILAIQGKDSQCEYVLKRIIRQDPKFLPARNSLAELQMRQERTEEAIETLQDALSVQPDDPVLLNNLGMCLMVRRDYEKALQMFDKAAGLKPENKKYRANMAVALGLMGREEESLSLFKQIMPEDEAIHNLDVLRKAQKKTEKPTPAVSSAAANPHQVTK